CGEDRRRLPEESDRDCHRWNRLRAKRHHSEVLPRTHRVGLPESSVVVRPKLTRIEAELVQMCSVGEGSSMSFLNHAQQQTSRLTCPMRPGVLMDFDAVIHETGTQFSRIAT